MSNGTLTLPEWVYILWRELSDDRVSEYEKAMDWLFAETASAIMLSGMVVSEGLRLAIAAAPGKPLASREDQLGVLGLVTALDPLDMLTEDEEHYRGCACSERKAEHVIDVRVDSLEGWRARDFHRV
eukprot:1796855-Amphidinium_carterae.1